MMMMMMMMMIIIIIIIIMIMIKMMMMTGVMPRPACGAPAYTEHWHSKSFDL